MTEQAIQAILTVIIVAVGFCLGMKSATVYNSKKYKKMKEALERLREYGYNDDQMAKANGVLEKDKDGYVYGTAKKALED